MLQERLVKRVIVLTSLGEKVGRDKRENSLQILVNPIQQKMTDAQVILLDSKKYIDDFYR